MLNNAQQYLTINLIKTMSVSKFANYFSSTGKSFFVLRDKRTKKILNISATEDGLKWTTNFPGNFIYYTNAKLKVTSDFVYLVPNDGNKNSSLQKSDLVYVEEIENHR